MIQRLMRRLGALLAAVLFGVGLFCGCGARAKVDAADYVSVCYTGKPGSAVASVSFDAPAFRDAVYRAMGLSATPETGSQEAAAAAKAQSALALSATPETGLSNGDTVTVSGTVDSKSLLGTGVAVAFTPRTFTVEGLDDTTPLDPFAELGVQWAGAAPELTLLLSPPAAQTETPYGWISYTTSGNTGLAAGEAVTVKASADAAALRRLGYSLSRSEAVYTAPENCDCFVQDWSFVNAEGQQRLQAACDLALTGLAVDFPPGVSLRQAGTEVTKLNASMQYSDFAIEACSYLSLQDADRPKTGEGWRNALVCVYRFQLSTDGAESVTAYSAFALPDVTVTATGDILQSEPVWYYRTAELSRENLSIRPEGGTYRVQGAAFSLAATLETASTPAVVPPAPAEAAVPGA